MTSAFVELDVEEQLFAAVVHCPLVACEELLGHLTEVDARNGSGRTLLHMAVRMGRLDWTERLLGKGADPNARDGAMTTVLDVAKEMAGKHPEGEDRKTILRLVRLAVELRGKTSSAAEGGKSTGEDKGVGPLEADRLPPSMALDRCVERLRHEVVDQIEDLSLHLVESSAEAKDQFKALGKDSAYLRESVTSVRTGLVNLVSQMSTYLEFLKVRLSAVGEQVGAISDNAPFLRKGVLESKADMASLSRKVVSLGSALAEVKADVTSVRSSQGVVAQELSKLGKAVRDQEGALAARDVLLATLETSVTSLANKMNGPPPPPTGPQPSTHVIPPEDDSDWDEDETAMEVCVEGILHKTWILNETGDKVSKVKSIYNKIYLVSPLTSTVLNFLQSQPEVMISVDCDSNKIGGMKEHVHDHDGSVCTGSHMTSFADLQDKRVYLGSLVGPNASENRMMGLFTRSLTQLAMYLAFRNAGKPYYVGEYDLENQFQAIINDGRVRKFTEGKWVNWFIYVSLAPNSHNAREMMLISAVPAIYVENGAGNATSILRDELPSLLDYYVDHVLVELHKTQIDP